MLEAYRKHVAERAAEGVVPKPLDAEQVAGLVELLKNPPQGEEAVILDLLENRIPPGVDEAAYVKAGFLTAITKGEVESPLVSREKAAELLGTMQGGYNIAPLVDLLDDDALASIAAKALSHTLLMFDAFYDVEEKAKAGNTYAQQVLQSWADAEWFTSKEKVAEKLPLKYSKSLVKLTLMTCLRRLMHGHVQISQCTRKRCLKWSVTVSTQINRVALVQSIKLKSCKRWYSIGLRR